MHCEGNFSYTSCLFIVALVSSGLEPVDSFQGFETLLQASGSDDVLWSSDTQRLDDWSEMVRTACGTVQDG